MWAVGLAAAVASWAGWVGLASMCGWTDKWNVCGVVTVYLAWLLPLAVDVYALIGFRVWLRSGTASEMTRTFARQSTFAAIGLGVGGNAGYHLMVSFDWADAPWPVVVVVSALPPVMLGAVAHLSALINRDHAGSKPVSVVKTQATPVETTSRVQRETTPDVPDLPAPAPVQFPADKRVYVPPSRPTQRRTETPKPAAKTVPARTQTTVRPTDEDHLKTIRETYPDWSSKTVSLGQIKTAVGTSGQATAIRLRDALYPNGRPDQTTTQAASDDDKETAVAGLDLPVREPRELVSAGVNGNHFDPKDN